MVRYLCRQTKIWIFKSFMLPAALLYGLKQGHWIVRMRHVHAFGLKCLHRVMGGCYWNEFVKPEIIWWNWIEACYQLIPWMATMVIGARGMLPRCWSYSIDWFLSQERLLVLTGNWNWKGVLLAAAHDYCMQSPGYPSLSLTDATQLTCGRTRIEDMPASPQASAISIERKIIQEETALKCLRALCYSSRKDCPYQQFWLTP